MPLPHVGGIDVASTEALNQPEKAIKAYERIVANDPNHKEAQAALDGLYQSEKKWSRLLEENVTIAERLGQEGYRTVAVMPVR